MEYQRTLDLTHLLKKKSFFLFGPRATGKTYLIKRQFGESVCNINLLKTDIFLHLSDRPGELEEIIELSKKKTIVIDEIQKLPILLDEVHRLIEEKQLRFLLTGSSAHKLKSGNVNLLAGRAWEAKLFPLTSPEIPDFDLCRYLTYGGLPSIYSSDEPIEELNAYTHTYLTEEIKAEGLVRGLPRFARFLKIAALCSGTIVNFTSVASDIGSSPSTVIEYFRLLEDTLIGFLIEPWGQGRKRKEVSTAKFYMFDTGVTNFFASVNSIPEASDLFGRAFEQFIAMELRAAISYARLPVKLSFWRTYDKHEVDFVIEDIAAIEVKASKHASDKDAKGLFTLKDEAKFKSFIVVSRDSVERVSSGITFLHYKSFLERLWSGKLLS